MPSIQVTEEQRDYLDEVRERLAADHVGAYGHVRPQDAVQYLIDSHEGTVASSDGTSDAEGEAAEPADASGEEDGEAIDDGDGEETLNAMMNLLETHDDKWEESDDDDSRYVVHLPDGDEHVRTKGEVKSLLFKQFR